MSVVQPGVNCSRMLSCLFFFFFQAEDGIRDHCVSGVQTCALPIFRPAIENLILGPFPFPGHRNPAFGSKRVLGVFTENFFALHQRDLGRSGQLGTGTANMRPSPWIFHAPINRKPSSESASCSAASPSWP